MIPIAIYLPQFHPFKENDEWWGEGFTEWKNVVKGKPLFKNHYQPHLPADLGFYDLRLKEIHQQQIKLAKNNGIEGFCYYHYWFNGKRLMHSALDIVLENNLDFPFMLCWANENWTRKWDGKDQEILIKQNYSTQDDINHITYLCENAFLHKNYIKIDNKPVLIIYRPLLFPDVKKTIQLWRQIVKNFGYKDLHLIMVNTYQTEIKANELGFDAVMDFQPNFSNVQRIIPNKIMIKLHNSNIKKTPYWDHIICDYKKFSEAAYKAFLTIQKSQNVNPCITPMWDNTARRKTGGYILKNSTPKIYKDWLTKVLKSIKVTDKKDNFLFINAWNEWAEGNHLEPCEKWESDYLKATKEALSEY